MPKWVCCGFGSRPVPHGYGLLLFPEVCFSFGQLTVPFVGSISIPWWLRWTLFKWNGWHQLICLTFSCWTLNIKEADPETRSALKPVHIHLTDCVEAVREVTALTTCWPGIPVHLSMEEMLQRWSQVDFVQMPGWSHSGHTDLVFMKHLHEASLFDCWLQRVLDWRRVIDYIIIIFIIVFRVICQSHQGWMVVERCWWRTCVRAVDFGKQLGLSRCVTCVNMKLPSWMKVL